MRKLNPILCSVLLSLLQVLVGSTVAGWQGQSVATVSTTLSSPERELAASIKVETIRDVVTALSAAEIQGRGTAQPGGERAAQYLAARFEQLGLKPLGNKNTYFQTIRFREFNYLTETSLKIGEETINLGPDFVVMPPAGNEKSVSGQMVFVAYGLVAAQINRDDLAGIKVEGKIIVMIQGPPANISKESWRKVKAQSAVIRGLFSKGASAIIFIRHGREERPFAEMADYLVRRQIEPADEDELPSFVPPFLAVSDATAEKLFAGSGTTRAEALANAESNNFKPINLKQSAKITVRLKKASGVGNNVIGLLEGSDPKLKNEALIYSAHYDAYGVAADNRVYHGAADNAIGVGEMLAIAEAFTKAATKPKRSVIFMAVTGEEYGGYGTDYWVAHPTWKIKQVAGNLNLDGMGTEVYGDVKVVVGYGIEHSTLGTLLADVAVANDLKIIPDPRPDEKSFYRSDHYYFVKKGIPGIMILGAPGGETKVWIDRMKEWEKNDYHQPTDIIRPEWNWNGPRTMAVVLAVMGWRVASDESMPSWLPGSPFNRERGTNEPPPPEP